MFTTASILLAACLFLLLSGAALTSIREGERRAALRFGVAGLLLPLPYLLAGLAVFPSSERIAAALVVATALAALITFLPGRPRPALENDTPTRRIDERDTIFARWRLEPGSARFEAYYQKHPEKRAADDRFRQRAGLLAGGTVYHDPYLFAASEASFDAVAAFHAMLDDDPAPSQTIQPDPAQMSAFVKGWGMKLGAESVGITELKDTHLYSHVGRNEPYGQPVEMEHRYAIALTVEMSKTMLGHAPYGPTIMESAQQYLNAGAIAVQIAAFIKRLGYPAHAHIDGSYRVICPLVARDAGLGEIGRIGLLMTPRLGPRVRLAVVTTDLPLLVDRRDREHSVADFCAHCQKCATACPSQAIPTGERYEIDGVRRWQIDSEACFTYWCTVGTDCGRCVSVCPYSHPDNFLHNAVRLGVRHAPLFRRMAVRLDDLFYGKVPAPLPVDGWLDVSSEGSPRDSR
jgi:ferredoxin